MTMPERIMRLIAVNGFAKESAPCEYLPTAYIQGDDRTTLEWNHCKRPGKKREKKNTTMAMIG